MLFLHNTVSLIPSYLAFMKSILVTGASGNLGQAVVKRFLGEGYHVIGTLAPGEKVNEELKSEYFETVVIDLTDEYETSALISNIIQKNKQIDAAVLTVGGFAMGNIAETGSEEIRKMIRLNFDTAYHTARPLIKHMKEKGRGRIFFIGARPGLESGFSKGMMAYGLSKSMVIRLAEMINLEAKGTDVTATVIIPSTIDTPQNRVAMPEADASRWVKAEDIADVIAFYCGQQGNAIREAVVKIYGRS